MFFAIIAISYTLAINVFGFRIVRIQRADRKKNGEPIQTPQKELAPAKTPHTLSASPHTKETTTSEQTNIEKQENKETQTKAQPREKSSSKSKTKSDTQNAKTTPTPHNGDKIEKEDLLAEEKLNMKRYERIPDIKILLVAVFGGALGEFASFLIYKYRTTNTFLMVALPVMISVWIYLFYILFGRVFIL